MEPNMFLKRIEQKPYLLYVDYDFNLRLDSLMRIAQKICRGFVLDNHNKTIYHEACKYFAADDSCAWDLNKGLYLYGDTGVGKTMFFKIFHTLMKAPGIIQHSGKNGFELFTVNFLVDGYSERGPVFWKNQNLNVTSESYPKPIHIAVDDLGQNSRTASYYGNQVDVIAELIQRRYNAYTDNYVLTHASSNIKPSEIKEVYGKFSASRMREMFNVIPFPGSDRRK